MMRAQQRWFVRGTTTTGVMLGLLLASSVAFTRAAPVQIETILDPATDAATAERGARVQEVPALQGAYPEGPCDTIAPGMEGLANTSGRLPADLRVIGTSVQGRPIYAEYWGPPNPTHVVLVVGQVHGNECAPLRLVRAVRLHELRRYGIWLIPTLNPDGHAAGTRRNANLVDLNTDGRTRTQPETQALMAFTAEVQPALTLHVHSPNGFLGWFGTGTYVPGDAKTSGAVLSGALAADISKATGIPVRGAGARSDPKRWYLWQGQRTVAPTQEALLVELHPVSLDEAIQADPRTPVWSVARTDATVEKILTALDGRL